MPQRCETFVIGILDSNTMKPIGTGFVLSNNGLIISSYHVVVRALHLNKGDIIPGDMKVCLRFSSVRANGEAFIASELSSKNADIAIMRVEKLPDGIGVAILGPSQDCAGDTFVSIGYRDAAGGATGTIAPPEPEPTISKYARLLLRSDQIDKGMSGAPVLDTIQDRVVGMIMSTWYSDSAFGKDRETSFAIPSEAIKDVNNEINIIVPSTEIFYELVKSSHQILHNIPSNLGCNFIGRERETTIIINHITSHNSAILISGVSGIGKSELASHIANYFIETKTFKAIVWTTIDYKSEFKLAHLLDEIADVMKFHGFRNLQINEKISRVKSLLRAERILLVIDGYEDELDSKMIEFLRNMPNQSKLLLTSQKHIIAPFIEVVLLKELDFIASRELMLLMSKGKRFETASETDYQEIYLASGGLPNVLNWAVGQINSGRQTIETVVSSLARLKSKTAFKSLFEGSAENLSEIERKVMLGIAISPGSVSKRLLQFITQLEDDELDDVLEQLIIMNNIRSNGAFENEKVRYEANHLIKRIMRTKLTEIPDEVEDLVYRFIRYYSDLIESKEYADIEIKDVNSILHWCNRFEPNWLVDLIYALSYYFFSYGFWNEREKWGEIALNHCKSISNYKSAAWILINELGYMDIMRGNYEQAKSNLNNGVEMVRLASQLLSDNKLIEEDNKDQFGVQFTNSLALRYLGILYTRLTQYAKAENYFLSAISKLKVLGRKSIIANIKIEMADLYLKKKDYNSAKKFYEEALDYHLRQRCEKPWVNTWIAKALCGLGDIQLRDGNVQKAIARYKEALNKAYSRSSTYDIANIQIRLTTQYIAGNKLSSATHAIKEAIRYSSQLGSIELMNSLDDLILDYYHISSFKIGEDSQ